MAGDWIKIEHVTPDKPEVLDIADMLNISQGDALLGLIRVWTWADQQSLNGNAVSVTKNALCNISRVTNFADAMIKVGWLVGSDRSWTFPNFNRHNTETSKKRALTKKRVAKHRENVKQECNARSVTKALPEKRREENINTKKMLSKDNIKESSANASPAVAKISDPDLENLQAKIAAKKQPTQKFNPRTLPLPESLTGAEAAWSAWCDHRDEIKKPITPTAARQLLAKGQQMGAVRFKAAIRHSAANGWQGLFEPEAHTVGGKSPPQQFKTKAEREEEYLKRLFLECEARDRGETYDDRSADDKIIDVTTWDLSEPLN